MEIIDWNLPLETDEPTPRAVTMIQMNGFDGTPPTVAVTYDGATRVYDEQGRPASWQMGLLPKIRNVRALRTSDECLRRMEWLVRRLAERQLESCIAARSEAREIVKLLPVPPVDPDVINARKLVADGYHQDGSPSYEGVMNGDRDNDEAFQMALAGLQRGRELAHAEYTLGPPPGPNDDFLTYRRKLAADGQ